MNYIVVREIGTRQYYGLHCGTRNRNETVLLAILWYVK